VVYHAGDHTAFALALEAAGLAASAFSDAGSLDQARNNLIALVEKHAYVSDAPAEHLTLEQAVLTYWDEWLIERGFLRLKGAPLSLDPLFVKRDDHSSF